MFVVEDGRELRAKEQDQTRNITPRQHGDHSADRAIDLIVVKVIQARRKDVLRNFPQQPREKRARQRVSQRDLRFAA